MKLSEFIISIFIVTAFFIFFSCHSSNDEIYIPDRVESLSESRYNKFHTLLLEAYEQNDNYSIGFQLCNLQVKGSRPYDHFLMAIKEDISHCESIFSMQNLADKGFYRTQYKTDTLKFKMLFDFCLNELGSDAYTKYETKTKNREKDFKNSFPKLDSTKLDQNLIFALKEIRLRDQKYRAKMADFRIINKQELFEFQSQLDSINLISVDSIINNTGYPRYENVGYPLDKTVFMVLHHQGNVAVRKKYFNMLNKHFSLEEIDLFNTRTNQIENNE